MAKSTASNTLLALWYPVILLLNMSSPIVKCECLRDGKCASKCPKFTIFVEYSREKHVPLSIPIESQIKFVETTFHRLQHFFNMITRIEFCKTVSFNFQSFNNLKKYVPINGVFEVVNK